MQERRLSISEVPNVWMRTLSGIFDVASTDSMESSLVSLPRFEPPTKGGPL